MASIRNFIGNFLVIIMVLTFYQRVTNFNLLVHEKWSNFKRKAILFSVCAVMFASYLLISFGHFHEPFRLLIGVSGVATIIFISERRIYLTSIIASFLFIYLLRIGIMTVAAPIIFLMNIENTLWFYPVALIFEVGIYWLVYKKIIFENGISALEEKGIKILVFIIAILTLFLYGGIYQLIDYIDYTGYPLYERAFLNYIMMFIAIIASIAYLIYTLTQEHRKKMELEQQNLRLDVRLETVRLELVEQAKIAKQEYDNYRNLVRTHHNFRGVIPTVLTLTHGLVEDLANIINADKSEQVERVENLLNMVKMLGQRTNIKFLEYDLQSEITHLNFPDDRIEVAYALGELKQKALDLNVYFNISNKAIWDDLQIENLEFVQLLYNLVDNAIKETTKLDEKGRLVTISFANDFDGYFKLEVSDNADPFPLHILQNLGQPDNSTNGTGDGYPEIFALLKKHYASFEIAEWFDYNQDDEEHYKTITVIFDDCNQKLIESSYRMHELKSALENSVFDIVS